MQVTHSAGTSVHGLEKGWIQTIGTSFEWVNRMKNTLLALINDSRPYQTCRRTYPATISGPQLVLRLFSLGVSRQPFLGPDT
jgi:hypothetical protein